MRLLFKIGFFVIAAIFCIYRLFTFFNEKIHPSKQTTPAQSNVVNPITTNQQNQPNGNDPGDWRIVGTIEIDGFKSVVLSSKTGLRFESVLLFTGYDSNLSGVIDGKRVTRFTGSTPEVKNQK